MNDSIQSTATQLPESVLKARARAEQLVGEAGAYGAAEPTISDVLRQKVADAYSSNLDIVEPLDRATMDYLGAPQAGREKYQDIFNPFARERLVSQYTGTKALPMLSLSSMYGQRLGRIEDVLGAGVRGYEAQTRAVLGKAEAARQSYQDAVSEFSLLEQLSRQAEEMGLAREKFAWRKIQPTGTGTYFERTADVRKQVADDARGGMFLGDIQTKYSGQLDVDEIVRIYTANTSYGEPQEAYAREILGLEPPEPEIEKERPWWEKAGEFFGIY